MLYSLQGWAGLPDLRLSPVWRWLFIVVFLFDGGATIIWSMAKLRNSVEKGLITTGPFAIVRHPIYAAFLWNGTGILAFLLESWTVLLGVIPLHLLWNLLVRPEEQDLWQRFGDQYLNYCQKTDRFFPRLSSLKQLMQQNGED
ncbi:MAG: isoprenylcysteine carboxylmethyltransferase family protein [Candidatus Marinimicrobia bacterium]|nr:isoprenylcysteine carboxylmethyltransferase family protein [Candidatus Neomarinimicrobiota bacterium]